MHLSWNSFNYGIPILFLKVGLWILHMLNLQIKVWNVWNIIVLIGFLAMDLVMDLWGRGVESEEGGLVISSFYLLWNKYKFVRENLKISDTFLENFIHVFFIGLLNLDIQWNNHLLGKTWRITFLQLWNLNNWKILLTPLFMSWVTIKTRRTWQ